MAPVNQQTDVIVVDSRDNPAIVFVIVDQCKVPVMKVKMHNTCYVMKLVSDVCHLELDLTDCEKNDL